jgi:hypothetical protein
MSNETVRSAIARLEAEIVALREALTWCGDGNCIHATPEQRRGMHTNGGCRYKQRAWDALAATSAHLAGQVRGEVLREAADVCFALMGPVSDKRTLAMQEAAHEIVQLAKEAEKAR